MVASIRVGSEIESQCGRCHDATTHKVVAMDKGKPRRCRCLTCEAEHLYRVPKGPEAPRSRKKSATGGRKPPDSNAAFKKAIETAPDEPPVAYTLSGRFRQGQRLKHGEFGLGVVLQVLREHVIEVIFKEGVRKLAMNR